MPNARSLDGESGAERMPVRLRLYVSAVSPISARAVVNLRRFLDAHLAGHHSLEICELSANAAQARRDQIIASPTLLVLNENPPRRLIGDLSNEAKLRAALVQGF